jgi:hypothetical protein
MRIAMMESVLVVRADEKLTAFIELESAELLTVRGSRQRGLKRFI